MTRVPPGRNTGVAPQGSTPVFHPATTRRVVFDTNVLVSLYVFADSRFTPLRGKIECGDWVALTNEACLGEFRRVLGYPLFKLTDARQQQALADYAAHVVRDAGPACATLANLPRCKDRDDQKFLELARDARADWLVTSDKALLRLARRDKLRGLFRILTPETALAEAAD